MITPSFSITATERVLPKLALDFTTASLDNRITFTRATDATHPATYVNSSGAVTAATNNQPRFDYDPVTLACKGLLIEEIRTNLLTYSEQMSNAAWNKVRASVPATTYSSPDGLANALKLTEDSSASTTHYVQQVFSFSATTYVFSVFLKAAERSWAYITRAGSGVWFNLQTGQIGSNNTGFTGAIERFADGWYKCSISFTATAGSSTCQVYLSTGNLISSYTGDGTSGIYVWGAQLEAGAFATSYIPTTSAALTRNADVATMTGTNFSDWYNQSEGAFVLQAARYVGTGGSMTHFSVSDGTNLDAYRLYSSGADGVEYFTGLDNNVTQWDRSRSSVTSDTPFKLCATYKLNNIAFALNGSAVTTDSIATIPTVDRLLFGQTGNGTAGQGRQYIQKLFYYPQVFTSAETTAFSK